MTEGVLRTHKEEKRIKKKPHSSRSEKKWMREKYKTL